MTVKDEFNRQVWQTALLTAALFAVPGATAGAQEPEHPSPEWTERERSGFAG